MAGMALSDAGKARAGMGMDCADWKNEGRPGLLIGNFARESLSLYHNLGEARFRDDAFRAGVGTPSQLFLTFGAFFFDFDNDGWQDVFAANGHIDDFVNTKDSAISYEQRSLFFRNDGKGAFSEIGMQLGPAAEQKIVGRGAAHGDYDGDGDADIAVIWNNKKGLLWRNDGGNARSWLGIRLHGSSSNRDGIGAKIKVTANGLTQTSFRKSGGSFLSESSPWPLFGLGAARNADVEITWPSGSTTIHPNLEAGRYHDLHESKLSSAIRL